MRKLKVRSYRSLGEGKAETPRQARACYALLPPGTATIFLSMVQNQTMVMFGDLSAKQLFSDPNLCPAGVSALWAGLRLSVHHTEL